MTVVAPLHPELHDERRNILSQPISEVSLNENPAPHLRDSSATTSQQSEQRQLDSPKKKELNHG